MHATYPWIRPFLISFSTWMLCDLATAQQTVPGTGTRILEVGDDFEDPEWGYIKNLPKSTDNLDNQMRKPTGKSTNGRWYEGIKRGQPDLIRRVSTPTGGLPGSQGALALRSIHTGIPNQPSYRQQQDDFIGNIMSRFGKIPVSRSPSVVTRVFLPPVDQWENRSGCHFAFRLALETTVSKSNRDKKSGRRSLLIRKTRETETYWPGIFIVFEDKDTTKNQYDSAYIRIRGNSRGGDFKAMPITKTGWWTMGLSASPDGAVHYYARPGIDALTAEDHITTQRPYGFRAERLRSYFFNVCSADDGQTWSTEWIIDDPEVYVKR